MEIQIDYVPMNNEEVETAAELLAAIIVNQIKKAGTVSKLKDTYREDPDHGTIDTV